jgi:hypothetical protein
MGRNDEEKSILEECTFISFATNNPMAIGSVQVACKMTILLLLFLYTVKPLGRKPWSGNTLVLVYLRFPFIVIKGLLAQQYLHSAVARQAELFHLLSFFQGVI